MVINSLIPCYTAMLWNNFVTIEVNKITGRWLTDVKEPPTFNGNCPHQICICLIYEMDRSGAAGCNIKNATKINLKAKYRETTFLNNTRINCQVKQKLYAPCVQNFRMISLLNGSYWKNIHRDFCLRQILNRMSKLQRPPESKFSKWHADLAARFKFKCFYCFVN